MIVIMSRFRAYTAYRAGTRKRWQNYLGHFRIL